MIYGILDKELKLPDISGLQAEIHGDTMGTKAPKRPHTMTYDSLRESAQNPYNN